MSKYVNYDIYKTKEKDLFTFKWEARDSNGMFITSAMTKLGLKWAVKKEMRSRETEFIENATVKY